MVKRDDSGSGLRAGFVRGDGLSQQPKKENQPKAEEPAVKKQPPVAEPPAREPEDLSGPTMTMQGVSGKKITGAVKVIKVIKADKPAEHEAEHTAAAAPAAVEAAPASAPSEPAAAPAAAKEKPAETVQAVEKPAASVEHKPAEQMPVEQKAAEPKAAEPKADESKAAEHKPAEHKPVEHKPAEHAAAPAHKIPAEGPVETPHVSPKSYVAPPYDNRPARPQSGYGNRPQSERAPGQGGSYTPRPQGQGGPGQGGYQGGGYQGNRPQSGPPGQGGYQGGGYQGNRPQGGPPGQGGYQGGGYQGNRPQGGPPGQGGYQGGGYQGNRPQGGPPGQGGYQGGGYQGNRPQGGPPGQGGYQGGGYQGNRPQGGPPGQGGGYQGNRPQGGPPGQGGYGNRPQGGGYQGRPSGGSSDDQKEKLPEAPRSSFVTRGAFDNAKRDDKRDVKKDTSKIVPDTKDKHRTLQRQAQALSGQGVTAALSDENVLETLYKEPAKGAKNRSGRGGRRYQPSAPVVRAVLTHVKLPEGLTVKEFAEAIKKTAAEVIKKLIKFGIMATVNQEIDFDTATIIAEEFGITTEKTVEVTEEEILFDDTEDAEGDLVPRPPVVVVMGHVDHGKTSILDRIRSSSVATGEAGGITQHIGAYTVKAKNRQITFLDTPGHEAFTTMRARGAQVTDIAILVVAVDDGVMPQTIEAINHAKAANTQIVVALNKIDKEGANIDKVKQELSLHELIPEEWGGTTVMVPVSAKTGQGMDELLEMVLLTADLLDLKSNPNKQAKGTVIEAKLDKNRGPVATVLVQRGTLRTGDTLVTGSIIGHVRAMTDDKGNMVKKAGPSIPVEILGLPGVPEAGELFYAVTDDKVARALADRRRIVQREQQLRASSRMSLDTLFTQMAAGEVKDLNIIIKADVQGSSEALKQSLEKLSGSEVRVKVIHNAVGAITESDIRLAEVSNAIVIGFNVRPAANVAELAKDEGVDVRMYRIIYNAIDDIEAAMKGMLTPKFKETILGHAQVRQVFKVTGVGTIAGCMVTDGKILRSSEVRVVRDGIVIHEGKLVSLKRFKDDAREVATGFECGIGLDKFNDIKENDMIEAFEMTEIERS